MGLGSHSPLTGTQLQTAPSEFKSPLPTTTFHDPPMSLSEVARSSRQDSPMTMFLDSTSGMNSYWAGDNTLSSSFGSSDRFDFSRMDFSSLNSSDSGPPFKIDTASYAPTLTQSTPPTSASLMSTTADGFQAMPPNVTYVPPTSTALQSALDPNSGYFTRYAPMLTSLQTALNSNSGYATSYAPTSTPLQSAMPSNVACYAPPTSTPLQSALNPNSGYAANCAPPMSTPLQLAPPTPAPLMSTTADGFQAIPPNGAYVPPSSTAQQSDPNGGYATSHAPPTLTAPPTSTPLSTTTAVNSATNTVMLPTGNPTKGMNEGMKEGEVISKKRKSYEERNAHCILPNGVRRARKGRRMEGAEDENTAAPKKRNTNANKKGKGKK